MDFASLMKSQIAKSSKNKDKDASKYVRGREVEAQRQEEYRKEQEAAEEARRIKELKRQRDEEEERERAALREAKKRRLAEESRIRREEEAAREEAARRKRLGLPPLLAQKRPDSGTPPPTTDEDIPDETLRQKLRDLNEPTTLFAESHAARLRRYKVLTAPKVALSNTPIPTTLALLPEAEQRVPSKPPPAALKDECNYLFRQIASYFTLVLTEWERALASRSAEITSSVTGRAATTSYTSSRSHMVPLFRHLEAGSIPDDVLAGIVEIVHAAQARRYVDASDAYLRLSIGKAAWPIGVTMVGIHERSAREKLHGEHQDRKAHIMSDESTRKYLQAIKASLGFAQTRWPPEDHLQLMG